VVKNFSVFALGGLSRSDFFIRGYWCLLCPLDAFAVEIILVRRERLFQKAIEVFQCFYAGGEAVFELFGLDFFEDLFEAGAGFQSFFD